MPTDRRPTESFEFESHLLQKASQIYVLLIFSSALSSSIGTKSTILCKFNEEIPIDKTVELSKYVSS